MNRPIAFVSGVILLTLALSACGGGETPGAPPSDTSEPLSLDEAAEIVLNEVISANTLDHEVIAFAWPTPLTIDDELTSFSPSEYEPGPTTLEIEEDAWFFWIDDAPGARFAHPSRFVLVDLFGGETIVEESEWWPIINGEDEWVVNRDYFDESFWVFSNVDRREFGSDADAVPVGDEDIGPTLTELVESDALPPGESPGAVVVINGGGESDREDAALTAGSQKMLNLFKDRTGFELNYLSPENDNNPDKTGDNDLDSIGDVLVDKSLNMKPGETLLLYVSGHGWVDEETGLGYAANFSERLLEHWLLEIDPEVTVIIIIDACFSGSFVDTTKKFADLTVTSTDAENFAYFDLDGEEDPNSDDVGTEFSSGFVEDWEEILSDQSELDRVRALGEDRGQNVWEALTGRSYLSALAKDAAFLTGKTFPQLVPGLPQTKPPRTVALEFSADLPDDTQFCDGGSPSLDAVDIVGVWTGLGCEETCAFIEVELDEPAPFEDYGFSADFTLTGAAGEETVFFLQAQDSEITGGQVGHNEPDGLGPTAFTYISEAGNVVLLFSLEAIEAGKYSYFESPVTVDIEISHTETPDSQGWCDSLSFDLTLIEFSPVRVALSTLEGDQITYTGPIQVQSFSLLEASFEVTDANGDPAMGEFLATLGDPPSDDRASHAGGDLDAAGMITLPLEVNWPEGSTQLWVNFDDVVYPVTEITVTP